MMELLRNVTLVAATITTGLSAGLLYFAAHSMMPGLGRSDDQTFVGGFQAIDKAINNPWMMLSYGGAMVFTVAAAALHLGADQRGVLVWIVAALVLYGVTLGITAIVHLPLNEEIQAAGPPEKIVDLAAVRERFEARWVRWNIVRTATATAAFGSLAVALLRS